MKMDLFHEDRHDFRRDTLSLFWEELRADFSDERINPLRFLPHRKWHEVRWIGAWDCQHLLADHKAGLIFSQFDKPDSETKDTALRPETLIFNLGPDLFAGTRDITRRAPFGCIPLHVWGPTMESVSATLEELRRKYLKPPPKVKKCPHFSVFSVTATGVERSCVKLANSTAMSDRALALHYGADFTGWHAGFIRALKAQRSGVSIFRGEPGTGKTSFIRHLISKLSRTHRFYYLPVRDYAMLAAPTMVEFWMRENDDADMAKLKKVVILEDAESLLVERGADNRDNLSNLLNISDGLLGEFLQVQVVCTINCSLDKLDPAIVRAGRLLASREFRRLHRTEAEALATAKGVALRLQDDYSLAEIYHSASGAPVESPPKQLGFAVR